MGLVEGGVGGGRGARAISSLRAPTLHRIVLSTQQHSNVCVPSQPAHCGKCQACVNAVHAFLLHMQAHKPTSQDRMDNHSPDVASLSSNRAYVHPPRQPRHPDISLPGLSGQPIRGLPSPGLFVLAVLSYYVITTLVIRLLQQVFALAGCSHPSCCQYVCSRIPGSRCLGGRQHHRP